MRNVRTLPSWRKALGAATLSLSVAGLVLAADEPGTSTDVNISVDTGATTRPSADVRTGDHARKHKKEVVVRQLSKLDSGTVYGNDGNKIGHINGLAIDAGRGRIAYAVVEFDRLADVIDKQFAVPWKAIDKKLDDKDFNKITYAINADAERLKNEKGLEQQRWPDMAELRAQNSYAFWRIEPYWQERQERSETPAGSENSAAKLQGMPVSTDEGLVVRAGNFTNHKVLDQDGKDIGKIEAVMADTNSGRLVYGLLQLDKSAGFDSDNLYAVPFQLLHISSTGKAEEKGGKVSTGAEGFKVVLKTTSDKLKTGPTIPQRDWPNMTQQWGEGVYSAYGVQPFWSHDRNRNAQP